MAKITYENKVALNVNSDIADVNKCNATDLNEIKNVVNENDDNTITNTNDIAKNAAKIGTLSNLNTTNKNNLVSSINEVNGKINALTAVTLYEHTSGRNGNIMLYDNVSNYSYIEIFYKDNDDNYNSMKLIYKTNNQNIVLSTLPISIGDTNYVRAKSSIYSVNGTNLNFISSADWNLSANAGTITTTLGKGVIYIVKVLGYK